VSAPWCAYIQLARSHTVGELTGPRGCWSARVPVPARACRSRPRVLIRARAGPRVLVRARAGPRACWSPRVLVPARAGPRACRSFRSPARAHVDPPGVLVRAHAGPAAHLPVRTSVPAHAGPPLTGRAHVDPQASVRPLAGPRGTAKRTRWRLGTIHKRRSVATGPRAQRSARAGDSARSTSGGPRAHRPACSPAPARRSTRSPVHECGPAHGTPFRERRSVPDIGSRAPVAAHRSAHVGSWRPLHGRRSARLAVDD
jgi:hypothetical protein